MSGSGRSAMIAAMAQPPTVLVTGSSRGLGRGAGGPGGKSLFSASPPRPAPASPTAGESCSPRGGRGGATRLWAARLADHGVQVLELRPGIMATDMTAGVKDKYDRLLAEG